MNEGEKKVVHKMIVIYCKANHKSINGMCEKCTDLDNYAMMRLERCPFGDSKPTCGTCTIHCYKMDMRERIREVMRFSGPRMIFRHPIDSIQHFYREYRRKKLYQVAERNRKNSR